MVLWCSSVTNSEVLPTSMRAAMHPVFGFTSEGNCVVQNISEHLSTSRSTLPFTMLKWTKWRSVKNWCLKIHSPWAGGTMDSDSIQIFYAIPFLTRAQPCFWGMPLTTKPSSQSPQEASSFTPTNSKGFENVWNMNAGDGYHPNLEPAILALETQSLSGPELCSPNPDRTTDRLAPCKRKNSTGLEHAQEPPSSESIKKWNHAAQLTREPQLPKGCSLGPMNRKIAGFAWNSGKAKTSARTLGTLAQYSLLSCRMFWKLRTSVHNLQIWSSSNS